MIHKMSPKIAIFLLMLLPAVVLQCRGFRDNDDLVEITGVTMGRIQYNIKYFQEDGIDLKASVDSLLAIWNQSLSTYIPDSEISKFNADSCFQFDSPYFFPVLETSKTVYEATDGAFDPTVGPLVNAFGFGPEESMSPDSATVDSLMQFVGFDKVSFDDQRVCKSIRGVALDFSAVAKGYAVDVVADYLTKRGVRDLLVEIGGELVCMGKKPDGSLWRTAIEDPTVEVFERKILAVLEITDKAVATSGNYRSYYVRNGRRYVHTLNPKTGYPIEHSLLSATVIADDCMTADAYATAFMVMGVDGARRILEANDALEGYLIFSTSEGLSTFATDGIAHQITRMDAKD